MVKKEIILSSAYLAPVEYYAKLYSYDTVYVERFDNYMKQTYRNRCVIASANGTLALTVPTEKTDEAKCLRQDSRVSEHGNWRHVHGNAFVAGYKQSPFFDYYADEFHAFFERKYTFLYDFNEELRQWVCSQIDLVPNVISTSEYMEASESINDYRELIHPKKDFAEVDSTFVPKPYYQVFDAKNGFTPNLSIIDLLFNMGPESLLVLRDSVKDNQITEILK